MPDANIMECPTSTTSTERPIINVKHEQDAPGNIRPPGNIQQRHPDKILTHKTGRQITFQVRYGSAKFTSYEPLDTLLWHPNGPLLLAEYVNYLAEGSRMEQRMLRTLIKRVPLLDTYLV